MRQITKVATLCMGLALVAAGAWAGDGCSYSTKVAKDSACSGAKIVQTADKGADCSGKSACGDKMVAAKTSGSGDAADAGAACSGEKKADCSGKSGCSDKMAGAATSGSGDAADGGEKKECSGTGECTGACGGDKNAQASQSGSGDAADGAGKTSAYKLGSVITPFAAMEAKSGAEKSLKDLAGEKATVLIFWNQTCPFVVEVENRVADFAKEYAGKGVSVVAIDGGVNNSVDAIKSHASDKPFPVLVNQDSTIAAAFGARHTPEVFLLDSNMKVVYHGAFDSGKKTDEAGNRDTFVKNVVDDMLAGNEPGITQTRSFGCSVKYAKGVKPLS
jgi:thiol-disulfide isomerase/thioredoxin